MQPATTPLMDPQYQQQQWMMMNQQPPVQQMYNYSQQPPPAATIPQHYTSPLSASIGGATPQPATADEIRTLWIGDLQYWMDEQYLLSCFAQTGEVVSAKVIRNKQSGQSEGYGFIEFVNRAAAERHLQAYNGTLMPNVEQLFRLNWASFGAGERKQDDTPDYTIFVGDLAADVTDYTLLETFRAHYPSVKGAKVVTDRLTGRTKGYGFVKFGDESEQLRAMTEMNGRLCSTRPMRIGPAANKKNVGSQQYPNASYPNTQATQNDDDPNNTTIFVGGLDPNVSDEHLKQVFSQYGQIVHVKIPVGKRCGFVQFADRSCAEEALRTLQGTQFGGQTVRLSWGRSPSNKQPQVEQSQYNGGYYGYETYGYAAPVAQDPSMYYGGYAAGYGGYTQPQQQLQSQQPQP
ncbi:putative RNA recognition motif domain, nucleotide-binding alpha-beta plait domain superfamily [Helianthus annuus]|uniref:RNA recognition motif domain, nucleotide-binding alpha-beta plait domain superfamily n=1 Tax=Helianthus annuus TaxID=4232 RepID=A0A9K3NKY6_HELAN|nr:polyadenylate-binding protein RBP45 [Helianthus annuus]KAF5804126.1 putative RNA recognition motif domain, nucleotide-binding alpha-beta plait domain superfamily [Helianthus annuus]KAJ0575100.1 putative RNA recognition motif domain, nucleotide-binding alpha-beta plait domain superfamily [Helianthus annuus]KAJ0748809.1 putative RNA recognition motif domain, nucleotide-binding alpha-beta plait domain superfamily [Helianthus annuus]KAJ0917203.1 putative RNA recognition motif domain, nucleotide-